jgi:RNA polymerase sigma factor (TIGR02999 family)
MTTQQTSELLADMARGDRGAADRLFELVYEELRGIAEAYHRRQPANLTLQPTSLVHEAYIRLVDHADAGYKDRAHFRAVAAKAMRNLLIDRARRAQSVKHGGAVHQVTLHEEFVGGRDEDVDALALEEALRKLGALDERKCRVVELRFFGGLSNEETAEVLGIARSTVAEDWRFARAWLVCELGGDASGEDAT